MAKTTPWLDAQAHSVNLAPFSPKGKNKHILLLYGNMTEKQIDRIMEETGFRDLTYQMNVPNRSITVFGMPFPLNASGNPDPRKVNFEPLLDIFPDAQLKEMTPQEVATHWKGMLTNTMMDTVYQVANSKQGIKLATTGELLGTNKNGKQVFKSQNSRYIQTANGDFIIPKSMKRPSNAFLYFDFKSPHAVQQASNLLLEDFLRANNELSIQQVHKWIENSYGAPSKNSMMFASIERELVNSIQLGLLARIREQASDQHVSKEVLQTATDIYSNLPFTELAQKRLDNPAVGHTPYMSFIARHFLEYVDNVNEIELIGKDAISLATLLPTSLSVSHVSKGDDQLENELSLFSQGQTNLNTISRDISTNFVSDASVLVSLENDSSEIESKAINGIMVNRQDHMTAMLTLASAQENTPVMVVVNADDPTTPGQVSRDSEAFHNYVFQNYLISGMVEISGSLAGSNLPQAHKRVYFSSGRRLEPTKTSAPMSLEVLTSLDELYDYSTNLKDRLAQVQRVSISNDAALNSTSISELLAHFQETQSDTTQLEVNKLQRRYTPMTNLVSGSTSVIPVNFVQSQNEAYKKIIRDVGNPDQFVLDQLGMSKEHLTNVLDAGQIDGVTMAVWNALKKQPFILADDAGNGKGRIIASVLYWSIKNGEVPVFVTKNTDLISDIIRDFRDIGVLDQINPLIISGSDVVDKETGDVYRDKNTIRKELDALNLSAKDTSGGLNYVPLNKAKQQYNIILTSYTQLSSVNKRALNKIPKRARVSKRSENFVMPLPYEALDNRAKLVVDTLMQSKLPVAVLDESHVGAAQSSFASQIVQNIQATTEGRGMLLRSSATWAKHATNAATCTDVLRGAFSQMELREMLATGGTQVQEAFATVLAANGSLIKRDHDMGRRKAITAEATEYLSRNRRITDTFAEILTMAKEFNKLQKSAYYKSKKITNTAESASKVSFTSPLHLIQDGLNVAMVADFAVEKGLESLENGRKPIFSVENTNATALEFLVERIHEEHIENNPNEPLPETIILDEEPSFAIALHRWLEREQSVTIERPYTAQEISDALARGEQVATNAKMKEVVSWRDELDPSQPDYQELEILNREITKKIDTLPFIPLSSMDYISRKINEHGWEGWEISGRNICVQKTEDGKFEIKHGQVSDNARAQIDFQQDKLDHIFLTRSGTTGISLHSDKRLARFGDSALRGRTLIALTPFQDISDEEQWANRAERKNQTVPSEIIRLSTGLPAVVRKIAMIENHRKSLSSLKSGSSESLKQMDTVDFVNHFGDLQMLYFLEENPHFVDSLELPQKYSELLKEGSVSINTESRSRYESFVHTVLGQLYYLKCSEQESFLDAFTRFYNAAYSLEKAQGRDPVNSAFIEASFKVNNSVQVSGVSKPVYENELDKPVVAEIVELTYAPKKIDIDALNETLQSSLYRNTEWLSNDGTLNKFRLKYDNAQFKNDYLQQILDLNIAKKNLLAVDENTTLEEALYGPKKIASLVAQQNWLDKGFKYINSIVLGGVYDSPINHGDQIVVLDVNIKKPTVESNISIADSWHITTVNTVTNTVEQKSLRDFERLFREPDSLRDLYDGKFDIDHEVVDKLRANSLNGRSEKRIIFRGNLLEAARINANEKIGQMVTLVNNKGQATQCLLAEPAFSLTKMLRKESKISKAALHAVIEVLKNDLVKSKQIKLVHSTFDPKTNFQAIINVSTYANRDEFTVTLPTNKTPRKGVSEQTFIDAGIPIASHNASSPVFKFKREYAENVFHALSSYGFNPELTMQEAMELEKLVADVQQNELALSSLLATTPNTVSTDSIEDAMLGVAASPSELPTSDTLEHFDIPEAVDMNALSQERDDSNTMVPTSDVAEEASAMDKTTAQLAEQFIKAGETSTPDTNPVMTDDPFAVDDLDMKVSSPEPVSNAPVIEDVQETKHNDPFELDGFDIKVPDTQNSVSGNSLPNEKPDAPVIGNVDDPFDVDGLTTKVAEREVNENPQEALTPEFDEPTTLADDPFASVFDELENESVQSQRLTMN